MSVKSCTYFRENCCLYSQDSHTLMKEAAVSFETSEHFYQTVPHQMLRYNSVHIHGREKNRSRVFSFIRFYSSAVGHNTFVLNRPEHKFQSSPFISKIQNAFNCIFSAPYLGRSWCFINYSDKLICRTAVLIVSGHTVIHR